MPASRASSAIFGRSVGRRAARACSTAARFLGTRPSRPRPSCSIASTSITSRRASPRPKTCRRVNCRASKRARRVPLSREPLASSSAPRRPPSRGSVAAILPRVAILALCCFHTPPRHVPYSSRCLHTSRPPSSHTRRPPSAAVAHRLHDGTRREGARDAVPRRALGRDPPGTPAACRVAAPLPPTQLRRDCARDHPASNGIVVGHAGAREEQAVGSSAVVGASAGNSAVVTPHTTHHLARGGPRSCGPPACGSLADSRL